MRLEMRRTCDAAPVQYEGTVEGHPFYFRARYDGWFFAVAATLDEAINAPSFDEANSGDMFPNGAFVREAQWGDGPFTASYMPVEEAERIIRWCAEAYMEAIQRDM